MALTRRSGWPAGSVIASAHLSNTHKDQAHLVWPSGSGSWHWQRAGHCADCPQTASYFDPVPRAGSDFPPDYYRWGLHHLHSSVSVHSSALNCNPWLSPLPNHPGLSVVGSVTIDAIDRVSVLPAFVSVVIGFHRSGLCPVARSRRAYRSVQVHIERVGFCSPHASHKSYDVHVPYNRFQ